MVYDLFYRKAVMVNQQYILWLMKSSPLYRKTLM